MDVVPGGSKWIPRCATTRELVGYKPHPFYARNAVQTFLATRRGEVCGRIAAILNQGHNVNHKERGASSASSSASTIRKRPPACSTPCDSGLPSKEFILRGPTNPSLNYELGMLIDGFDSPPTFMMTYNPPYYERLIENYGFRKTQDLYAFWGHLDMLPKIAAKLKPIAEQIIERYNVKLRPLDKSRSQEDVERFLSIYNRSLANTWGLCRCREARWPHGQGTALPDRARDGHGRRSRRPDGRRRLRPARLQSPHQGDRRPAVPLRLPATVAKQTAIKRIRLISTNVLPEYQRYGVGLVLMYGLVPKALEWGLQEAEFSWVLESNSLSHGSLKKGGAKITKTYRLYDWEGDGGSRSGNGADGGCRAVKSEAGFTESVPRIRRSAGNSRSPHQADLNQFIRVPWRIYKEDPHWVPPLLMTSRSFSTAASIRSTSTASHAIHRVRRRQTVGRILVSDDPNFNEQGGTNVGCFGMFECIDDKKAAHALLDAAAGWLRGRRASEIMGPIDYSINYPCGLLIEGFDTPPADHDEP